MYFENDSRVTGRDGWKFTYKGSDIAQQAQRLLGEYTAKETEARQQMSALMLDPAVSANGDAVQKAKLSVEQNGRVREQLLVWVHEFTRTPDRDFILGLGDVVFFGLAEAAT